MWLVTWSIAQLRNLAQAMAILAIAFCWHSSVPAQAQEAPPVDTLPIVLLDAVDPAQWSDTTLVATVGQTIHITNRGVRPHTFVLPEWGVRVELPTLKPVDLVVPDWVIVDDLFEFYCDEPGHADDGMKGTIQILSEDEAKSDLPPSSGGTPNPAAVTLIANDNLTWTPAKLDLVAGQILQVQNPGVIEHHIVVDEWGVNETISAGETVLVRVPTDAQPGTVFVFYCSVPGHRAAGMEGTITILDTGLPPSSTGGPGSTAAIRDVDIRQFIPDASMLGEGWSEIRSGNVRSIVPEWSEINVSVFPGDGIGVVFVGPAGSRAAIAVLPLETISLPANQVQQAIDDVQFALMQNWNTNSTSSVNLQNLPPPTGCDIAQRATGVTGLHTLPAGLTVCQVRNANVAIFVTIEGQLGNLSGVEASDQVIFLVLQRFGGSTGFNTDGLDSLVKIWSLSSEIDWLAPKYDGR